METKDTPQGIVGLRFARSLLSGDYEKAHLLLSAELKTEYPPMTLKESFERMMSREHAPDEVRDIICVLDNTDLGEPRLNADGWACVLIGLSGYVMTKAKPFGSDFLITELKLPGDLMIVPDLTEKAIRKITTELRSKGFFKRD